MSISDVVIKTKASILEQKKGVKVKVNFTLEQATKAQRWRYRCTLSLTSAIDGGEWSTPLRPVYRRERPVTHCIGSLLGPSASLNECGKSLSHRDYILGPSRLYRLSSPGPSRRV